MPALNAQPSHQRILTRWLLLALMALSALVSGCASAPSADPRDPWEPMNRKIYGFNDALDKAIVKPVAQTYKDTVPRLIRVGVDNFFSNLGDLWSFANAALQLKPKEAVSNITRFNLNTFFGLGGLLDIATEFNIQRYKGDFGQTLGYWGMPPGPYLVVPFLGPYTLRDAVVYPVDMRGNPVFYVKDIYSRYGLYGVQFLNLRVNLLGAGNLLEAAALDPYSFVRDFYWQHRQRQVLGDKADEVDDMKDDAPEK